MSALERRGTASLHAPACRPRDDARRETPLNIRQGGWNA